MAKRKNGEGTLRKRKDGRWEGRYNAGVDENGKTKVKYVLAKSMNECREKLEKAIAEYEEQQNIMNRCSYLKNGDPTLQEWYEIWRDSFLKASAKEYTVQGYINSFENKILPRIGNIKLKEISTVTCQQLLMDLLSNGRERYVKEKGSGLSVKTVISGQRWIFYTRLALKGRN